MNAYNDVTEMIGHTPLLWLARLSAGRPIYAKCEFMNPLSLKDRPMLQIIEDAEALLKISTPEALEALWARGFAEE